MSSEKKAPIIKKIIKKSHGGGHSGSSWKVAYADFVTAMMAFFLVMWLLAISSEQGREALADYFNELTMSDAVFNGGLPSAFTEGGAKRPGILEGGCFSPKSEGEATVNPDSQNEAVQAQITALLQASQKLMKNLEALPQGDEGGEGSGDAGKSDASAPSTPGQAQGGGEGGPLSPEDEALKKELLAQVQGAVGNTGSGQVEVERTKGGLRIQVMDQDGRPLFVLGGAKLTDLGRKLLSTVADSLQGKPNKISVEGHTDGLRMSGQLVTNWELSTARASAARIILSQSGVPNDRLTAVTGYADTQPLPGTDPNDPQNRRISIMVWDDAASPPPAPKGAPVRPKTQGPGAKAAPPPAPSRPSAAAPARPRLPTAKPSSKAPAKTREQVERDLIDSSMQRAATDRSTVGPPIPAKPPGQD